MEVSIIGQEKDSLLLLSVKSVKMGPDAGLGCFADHQFHKRDHITVYFGVRSYHKKIDHLQQLQFITGKNLEMNPKEGGRRPLYFGCHFTNTWYYGIRGEDHNKYDMNRHEGKNPNCQTDGFVITRTSRIDKGEELRQDYGYKNTAVKFGTKQHKNTKNYYSDDSFIVNAHELV